MSDPQTSDARPWWLDAKIYELYVDKFAGTFNGLIERLPYLADLGINTLHILPHYPSPMVDQGYDVSDYRGVRPELGTLDDFRRFTDAAHALGLRIIVDLAVNHTSNKHPWFIEASSSKDNPKRNYYLWSDTPDRFPEGINAFPDIKQSNWIWNEATQDYYYATFYPEQPDVNWDNEEVVREMFDTMEHLIHLGADGFRIDAAAHVIKRDGTSCKSLPETHALFKRMRTYLNEKHPDVVMLAEAGESGRELVRYFGEGDEFHLAYNFPLTCALWGKILFDDQSMFEATSHETGTIPASCQWVTFLRNHDDLDVRMAGEEFFRRVIDAVDPEHRFVFNHVTTTSVRLATALRGDTKNIIDAFKLLYSIPGAPVCYYGDELGAGNLPHDPSVVDTRLFVRGVFDWEEAGRQNNMPGSILSEAREVIRNRT